MLKICPLGVEGIVIDHEDVGPDLTWLAIVEHTDAFWSWLHGLHRFHVDLDLSSDEIIGVNPTMFTLDIVEGSLERPDFVPLAYWWGY